MKERAKVGTGELTPFKKGSTGSECYEGSTSKEHVREGFTHNVNFERTDKNVTELEPFKTGPTTPGRNMQADTTKMEEGDQGNPTYPAFRKKESSGILNPHGYRAFKS